ncbi:hypothetical protein sos41_36520 [Alphaproteobacteria bacterium SO-S41]|nr:hypothetical protein sos41_36520 [Alphaproteobacteria bacterium SO-S41]
MSLDVEALLQPVSDEEPAGPDLSYDPDFRRISRELESAVEKERPGDDPAVGPAADTAVALLARAKDLWIASYGFCFSLYSGDLPRCAGLLDVMAGITERFWETCHPQLDEGSDPAGGRREACRQIAIIGRSVKHLERLYLPPLKSKGRISFKDIAGAADATIKAPQLLAQTAEAIRRAIDATDVEEWRTFSDLLGSMLDSSARVVAAFAAQVSSQEPDLQPLDAMLKRIKEFADAVIQKKDPAAAPAADVPADDAGGGYDSGPVRAFSGPIGSRQQAIAQLEAVQAFFKATEPSSPVPLLIDRVKRLAGMDFLQIMQNLAPMGLDEANRVLDHNRDGSGESSGYEETPSE